jgi:hypothetical protein
MLAGAAGHDALTVACEFVLGGGVISTPIVMNELRTLIAPHLSTVMIPSRLNRHKRRARKTEKMEKVGC